LRITSKVRKRKLMGRKKMKNMELLQEEYEWRGMIYHTALNCIRELQKFSLHHYNSKHDDIMCKAKI
jgi:hypothetical protein